MTKRVLDYIVERIKETWITLDVVKNEQNFGKHIPEYYQEIYEIKPNDTFLSVVRKTLGSDINKGNCVERIKLEYGKDFETSHEKKVKKANDIAINDFERSLGASLVNYESKLSQLRNLYLPANNQTLSSFSSERLGDTHALDSGDELKFFNSFLTFTYGDCNIENHNVFSSYLSSSVWSKNVLANYTLKVPIGDLEIALKSAKFPDKVYVFENNNVFDKISAIYKDKPIVLGSGWPNKAVQLLMKSLVENGSTIIYFGDLDPEGLAIAEFYVKEFGAKTPVHNSHYIRRFSNNGEKSVQKQQSYKGEVFENLMKLIQIYDSYIKEEFIVENKELNIFEMT